MGVSLSGGPVGRWIGETVEADVFLSPFLKGKGQFQCKQYPLCPEDSGLWGGLEKIIAYVGNSVGK